MKAFPTLATTTLALAALTTAGCVASPGEPTTETTAQSTAALGGREHHAPFLGFLSGEDITNAAGTGVTETAAGLATELGKYSYAATFVFNADGSSDGTGVWTAADGDTLDSSAHAVQVGQNADGTILSLDESHTVTGGTGRFAGATGSFQVHCKLNLNTNKVEGLIDGTLEP